MPFAFFLTAALASCPGGACGARAVYAQAVPPQQVRQLIRNDEVAHQSIVLNARKYSARPPRRFFGLFRRRR